MKNFFSDVIEHARPLSKKILFTSFMAGYLLAMVLFVFFRPQVHRFLDLIL